MKQQAREIQYTVRGVPPEVDRALRKKAAKRRLSLNQIIVEEIGGGDHGAAKARGFR